MEDAHMVVQRIIESRGIKTTWFAEQLGVSQSHISRLLSGERPWTPELRQKAAQVLMLPEDVLFLSEKSEASCDLSA
jgi:transcriptional regulator with XRE-family HTH domain